MPGPASVPGSQWVATRRPRHTSHRCQCVMSVIITRQFLRPSTKVFIFTKNSGKIDFLSAFACQTGRKLSVTITSSDKKYVAWWYFPPANKLIKRRCVTSQLLWFYSEWWLIVFILETPSRGRVTGVTAQWRHLTLSQDVTSMKIIKSYLFLGTHFSCFLCHARKQIKHNSQVDEFHLLDIFGCLSGSTRGSVNSGKVTFCGELFVICQTN